MANMRFGALMGVVWKKYDTFKNPSTANNEVNLTRKKLTNVRREALKERSASYYSMEPIVDDSYLPKHISNNIVDGR